MDKRVIHSIPHITTLLLGVVVMALSHPILGLIYLPIAIGVQVYFFRFICTRCLSHGSRTCPSGYGIISAKLFPASRDIPFPKAFGRHIWSVALQWFVPLGTGVIALYLEYPDLDPLLIISLAVFIMVAFVWLPISSRQKGCHACPQQRDCPWKRR